jgi:2-polyprenyl-3-methyl-5-hydroxy-6-metoxy-1,4-benzoquinol methylase
MRPDAKAYYRSYVANNIVSPLNEKLIEDILSFHPKSVLEFGCGVGKNLELLGDKVDEHLGIDISATAVDIARKKNLTVINGDERTLKTIKNHDIVFTCSVLDHIEEIDNIVSEFKRIANLAIVIAETNTKVGRFYYPHDYESLGFVKTGYVYVSNQANEEAPYHIWHYKRNQ